MAGCQRRRIQHLSKQPLQLRLHRLPHQLALMLRLRNTENLHAALSMRLRTALPLEDRLHVCDRPPTPDIWQP